MINLQSLMDDAKCYEAVHQLRWPEGVRWPPFDTPVLRYRNIRAMRPR